MVGQNSGAHIRATVLLSCTTSRLVWTLHKNRSRTYGADHKADRYYIYRDVILSARGLVHLRFWQVKNFHLSYFWAALGFGTIDSAPS